MDENLHDIEDLFFLELNDNEETPSEKVWEKVDKRLDKENVINIEKKYTSLKRIVVVLLFLLSGFAVYIINTNGNNKRLEEKISKDADKTKNTNNGLRLNEKLLIDSLKNIGFYNPAKKDNIPKKATELSIKRGETADNAKSQNNYTFENANSAKNIVKNKSLSNTSKKTNLASEPFYRMKIKNAGATDKQASAAQQKAYPNINKIIFLDGLIEPLIFSSLDSINTKDDLHLMASKKIILSEITNKSVKSLQNKPRENNQLSITPFFSPDIAWYHLSNDNINNQSANASELDREERHEFSSTYGLLVDYLINKNWGLQSGLVLSNTNIIVQPGTIYAQPDNAGNIKYRINTSSGYGYVLPAFSINPAIGDSLYAFTSSHSLQYIGIPLALTYNVTKSKFKFNLLAGVSSNFLLKAKLNTTVEKGFDNSIETVDNLVGPKKVYFSGIAGAGVDYKLMSNTAITFAPTMRFALNPINKDATVKSYPNSFGFVVGLKIGL